MSTTSMEDTTGSAPAEKFLPWLMPAVAFCLLVCVLYGLRVAHGWDLVHDVPLFHYIVFLMDHGRAPYRDIIDVNMPGTYMLEWSIVHGLGPGELGVWRADALSGLLVLVSALSIAGPRHRSAGIAGGALAYYSHLGEGPANLGQRDWYVAVFCLAAAACLVAFLRSHRPAWMAGFTGLLVLAATIKPPALLLALLALTIPFAHSFRRSRSFYRLLVWSIAGAAVPLAAVSIFLFHWSAWGSFLGMSRTFLPWYAAQHRVPLSTMIQDIVPFSYGPLAVVAALVFFSARLWKKRASAVLAGGTLIGALVFLVQRKGWGYHLGIELVFLSVFCMLAIALGLERRGPGRWLALLGLAVLAYTPVRIKISALHHAGYPMTTIAALQEDLTHMGGQTLSGNVQCLDMTMGGCINVLYRMQLMEPTSSIYDIYLFPEHPNSFTAAMQNRFLRELEQHPPEVMVLSSHIWPADRNGYDELARWDQFSVWLAQHYTMVRELTVPTHTNTAGYRIYKHV